MGISAEVLRLKLRQYYGATRRDRKKWAALVAFPLAGTLFGFPMGVSLARPDLPGYFLQAEPIHAILSTILAFAFLQGLGGGIFAHPSEIEFVLATPIRPRQFLVADFFFQVLMFQFFLLPFAAGVSLGIGIGTGNLLVGLAVLGVAEAFLLLPGLIAQSIGVMALTGHRWTARGVALAGAIGLLVPALHFVTPLPIRYSDLPTPAVFATSVVFGLVRGSGVDPPALLGLLGTLAVATLVWFSLSGREFFSGLRPIMLMSFGQPMDFSQFARLAAERKGRRVRLRVDVFRDPLWRTLTKLQVVRWARSGPLIGGIATVVMFGFMGVAVGAGMPGGNPILLFSAAVPVLAPSMLALPTVSMERDRLWVYAVVPDGIPKFFGALFLSLVAVGVPLAAGPPAIVMALTHSFSPLTVVAFAGASAGGSWAAAWILSRFEVPLGGFSLRQFLFFGSCGLGAGLFAMPAVAVEPLLQGNVLLSAGSAAAYAAGLFAIMRHLYGRVGRGAKSFVP